MPIPLNWPNLLTLCRIVLIPVVLILDPSGCLYPGFLLASWVFLTDFLDGLLARKMGMVTQAGMIFDPVADKLVVLAMFSYLFAVKRVPGWYVGLVFVRDLAQLASIPSLLWWRKIAFKVRPKLIARWGTALNFAILAYGFCRLWLEAYGYTDWPYGPIMLPVLLVSAAIEIYILVTYLPRFIQIYCGIHDTFE